MVNLLYIRTFPNINAWNTFVRDELTANRRKLTPITVVEQTTYKNGILKIIAITVYYTVEDL